MKAKYPNEIITWEDKENNIDVIEADHINQAYAEIIAIEKELDQTKIKLVKTEKEIDDYKKTVAGLNPNQEAKQSISGYGIVSLPPNAANGQVSGVVRGETLTNLAGTDGRGYNSSNSDILANEGTLEDGILTLKEGQTGEKNKNFKIKTGQLRDNTDYTIVVEIIENTLSKSITLIRPHELDITANLNISPEIEGTVALSFKTGQVVENAIQSFVRTSDTPGYIKLKNLMILEGDYTNRPIKYIEGTKSTISSFKIQGKNSLGTTKNITYITARDKDNKIVNLRSLPNGVKDEINIGERKVIIRTKEVVLNGGENWSIYKVHENTICFQSNIPDKVMGTGNHGYVIGFNYVYRGYDKDEEGYSFSGLTNRVYININKNKLVTNDINGFKEWLSENPVTLIYQLAEPEVIPVQVSGSVVSHPSGTVYIDPATTVAGIYNKGMTVTYTDLPIGEIEKVTKIDYETGLGTDLDVSAAIIAEDRLSFTHPKLTDGDIVFFEYFYDVETTQGECIIEYYDSRYTIKDSVTGKFYKWNIAVNDGVPSIELVEV